MIDIINQEAEHLQEYGKRSASGIFDKILKLKLYIFTVSPKIICFALYPLTVLKPCANMQSK
jgi:hypothetical protein